MAPAGGRLNRRKSQATQQIFELERPMSLRERLTAEMKEAMKAGEKAKLATVRMIQAAIKDRDIEARGAGKGQATEDEVLALLQKMIKQRNESAGVYDQGGRPELAENERNEAAIIAGFLPQQMDEAETRAAIEAAIAETGAAGPKDMGKVIGALKGKYAGRMDFSKASGLVKDALNAKA
ncbi:aspartyl-tRNA amidotransferase subunit B [Methylobacterium oxalidis]|uniref:Aspartyl-tRNA amidotransferase subunit B n=2 Tax=Methylobacterium oxalidis TaxID=944322 RepID=A0A512J3V3_9HYPH|nr:aspartyl-tRNA amidotransferase subunit B [Methylobacterium oxalidis]GLS62692.1 aspartyl-tRNA amidotransferase subunit B [Methylobacterium oxalidis]